MTVRKMHLRHHASYHFCDTKYELVNNESVPDGGDKFKLVVKISYLLKKQRSNGSPGLCCLAICRAGSERRIDITEWLKTKGTNFE